MTTTRPIQAFVALQPPEGEAAKVRLLRTLGSAGVDVAGDPREPAPTGAAQLAAHLEAHPEPTIVVFDGRLYPEHAALVRAQSHSFLLACPGTEPRPRPDDLHVLAALLNRISPMEELDGLKRQPVRSRAELRVVTEEIFAELEARGAPRSAASACADVLYELAANALLDAPVDADGQPTYAHRRDDPGLQISPEDAAVVAFGVKGTRAYLGAVDRFGRLTAEPLARTVEGLGARARVNHAGGGAGLGLRRIVEQSGLIAARVVPGQLTEVLCAVDLEEVRRRATGPKSLFFSVERG